MYIILFAMRGALIFAFCSTARALDARRARKESIRKAAHQHAHHNPRDASTALDVRGDSGGVRHLPHQQYAPGAVTSTHAGDGQAPDPHGKQQLQQVHHHHTATPDARGMLFATMAGLRGAVSLIMGQIVLAAVRSSEPAAVSVVRQGLYGSGGPSPHGTDAEKRDKYVTAQMMVWTSGFVLMSLVINAPMLSPLMRVLRLNTTSPMKQQVECYSTRLRLTGDAG